jgi:hypothetical protein
MRGPLEEQSVAKVMILAKELARENSGDPALRDGELTLSHEDVELHPDRQLKTPVIGLAKSKRNRELIIGCYMLLFIGITVFSVWFFTDTPGVSVPTATKTFSPSDSLRSSKTDSPIGPGVPTPTNKAIRFAEFGCASALCTLSCDASERIANAFMLSPDAATFTYANDRSVTVRPSHLPSSKIVLVCVPQQ